MKHIFTLLAAMFLAFTASAQSVVWCPPGAEWHYDAGTFAAAGFVNLKYVSNTYVNGKPCKRLIEHYKAVDQQLGTTQEVFTDYFTYEENGKVYVITPGIPSWQMLYDFNANPGDNWPMYGTNGQFQIYVGDTGTVVVQGQPLKFLSVGWSVNDDLEFDTIYERIGHAGYNYPWVPSVMSTDPQIYSLCNYSDNEITDWRNQDAACRILPPVSRPETTSETSIIIFPNPVSDNFTVQFENRDQQQFDLELRDVFGKLILQEKRILDRGETEILLANYPAGLYFLRVSGQNLSYTTKVIKQ